MLVFSLSLWHTKPEKREKEKKFKEFEKFKVKCTKPIEQSFFDFSTAELYFGKKSDRFTQIFGGEISHNRLTEKKGLEKNQTLSGRSKRKKEKLFFT